MDLRLVTGAATVGAGLGVVTLVVDATPAGLTMPPLATGATAVLYTTGDTDLAGAPEKLLPAMLLPVYETVGGGAPRRLVVCPAVTKNVFSLKTRCSGCVRWVCEPDDCCGQTDPNVVAGIPQPKRAPEGVDASAGAGAGAGVDARRGRSVSCGGRFAADPGAHLEPSTAGATSTGAP